MKETDRKERNLGDVISARPPLDHIRRPIFVDFECFNISPAFLRAFVGLQKLGNEFKHKQISKKQTSTTESWNSNFQWKSCASQLRSIVGPPD